MYNLSLLEDHVHPRIVQVLSYFARKVIILPEAFAY